MIYWNTHTLKYKFLCPYFSELLYSVKFWWERLWHFWCFPARLAKLNPLNFLKALQHLQVYGEKQWPSVKTFSVKFLKSKISPIKILHYTVQVLSCNPAALVVDKQHNCSPIHYFIFTDEGATIVAGGIFYVIK